MAARYTLLLIIVMTVWISGVNAGDSTEKQHIRDVIADGNFSGNIRWATFATFNEGDLSDFWANALGARVYWQSGSWHGFSFGMGGGASFNMGSADLTYLDPVVGKGNRFESQLFDVTDKSNRYNISFLEMFYLQYQYKNMRLQGGRLNLNTPLLNAQDSRMKTTAFEGLWAHYQTSIWHVQGGWLVKSSPRGVRDWYTIEESIGLFGRGYNTLGTNSGYKGNLRSAGIGVIGVDIKPNAHWDFKIWDAAIDNVMNTALLQTEYHHGFWTGGLQYLGQWGLHKGGNGDLERTYYDPGQQTNLMAGKVEYDDGHIAVSGNLTRITSSGRFVFPREFGTVDFYNFFSRYRLDGQGDSYSYVLKTEWHPEKADNLGIEVDYGFMDTPGIDQIALNKFRYPDFHQVNFNIRYKLKGLFEGAKVRFLYAGTFQAGDAVYEPTLVYNRFNFTHLMLFIDYKI
ncbi:MAG TPA: hypothetical protein DDY13_07355 [Cytophagales bacterium]|jgi:hypothetical protein|nr:hypothetical protein [Cytophagales bacterium]